jgi:hypothetical protein
LETSFKENYPDSVLEFFDTDSIQIEKPYGKGLHWFATLYNLSRIKYLLDKYDVSDNDWIINFDADVCFSNNEYEKLLDSNFGLIGIASDNVHDSPDGPFSHVSGCCIAIRGDIAKRMVSLTPSSLAEIEVNHLRKNNIPVMVDCAISYLAFFCGAMIKKINGKNGNINEYEEGVSKAIYHLEGMVDRLYGIPVKNRFHIPELILNRRNNDKA